MTGRTGVGAKRARTNNAAHMVQALMRSMDTLARRPPQCKPSQRPSTASRDGRQNPTPNATVDLPARTEKSCSSPTRDKQDGSCANKSIEPLDTIELDPNAFYGTAEQRRKATHPAVLKFLAQVNAALTSSVDGGSARASLWKVFPRQEFAFQWADSQAGIECNRLAYFSFEDHTSGTRKFLISSYEEFWRRYQQMPAEQRHHYEIIREGMPCHIFFDIEFVRPVNRSVDGGAAVTGLLELVREALEGRFQLSFSTEDVMHLDSSTEAKFSRHVVIRIPGAAFASAVQCGGFVKTLCAWAEERQDVDPRCAALFVRKEKGANPSAPPTVSADPSSNSALPAALCDNSRNGLPRAANTLETIAGRSVPDAAHQVETSKDGGERHNGRTDKTCMVDLGVYTRNRAFRLYLSSKFGKRAVLLPASDASDASNASDGPESSARKPTDAANQPGSAPPASHV
eukprot:CAMPEP_0118942450 /NCGR_PEP_ID=MMETSP1169-20130426/36159_1 /TAXON_ID=36882 /ORGANISM="Pyramimonas obovata, Strain CCMP722" /LENGTH=456 /DNA_ID=CAMNT_0006887467 /DNA_START=21 /DNA_END=1388 /DNA_ORIENTATION=-